MTIIVELSNGTTRRYKNASFGFSEKDANGLVDPLTSTLIVVTDDGDSFKFAPRIWNSVTFSID